MTKKQLERNIETLYDFLIVLGENYSELSNKVEKLEKEKEKEKSQ